MGYAKHGDLRERILETLRERGEMATPEIAEALEVDGGVARHYLKELVMDGQVKRRRLGKRLLMWSLTESRGK